MKINLLEIIKSLPADNFRGIGPAIGFATIYDHLKLAYGIDSQDTVSQYLNQLNRDGLIKLHRIENGDDENDIIIAVTLP